MIQIIGKKTFVSTKSNRPLFILYYGERAQDVQGLQTVSEFVDQSVFDKAQINGKYEVIYGRNYSGKAVISDLEPILK